MQAMLRFEWLFSAERDSHEITLKVAAILDDRPFTLLEGVGVWEGQMENGCMLVEYRDLSDISPQGMADAFNHYAERIGSELASEFRQDCVLASWQYVNGGLVAP